MLRKFFAFVLLIILFVTSAVAADVSWVTEEFILYPGDEFCLTFSFSDIVSEFTIICPTEIIVTGASYPIKKENNSYTIVFTEPGIEKYPDFAMRVSQDAKPGTYNVYFRYAYIWQGKEIKVAGMTLCAVVKVKDAPAKDSFILHLQAGFNMISVPLDPGKPWRLSDLSEFICGEKMPAPDGRLVFLPLCLIVWLNNQSGKFCTYTPTTAVESPFNAAVKGGEGYILIMKRAVTVEFTGTAWSNQSVTGTPSFWGEPGRQLGAEDWKHIFCLIEWELEPKNQLLQNFPNPFNPETWIPFKLKESSDTSITIYDVHGRVVRKLDLGYIPAGIYQTKAKSAYWDGTNDMGERVASGIYFYHLEAGKFSASRKMVILK